MSTNFYLSKNTDFTAIKRLSERVTASEVIGSSRVSHKQFYACENEIVYDSMLPKIDHYLLKEDARMAYMPTLGNNLNVGTYLVASGVSWYDENQSITIEASTPINIDCRMWRQTSSYYVWNNSYPFEEKYDLIRQKNVPNKYTAFDWAGRTKSVGGIAFELLNIFEEKGDENLPKRRKILLDKEAFFQTPLAARSFPTQPNVGIPQIEGSDSYSENDPNRVRYVKPSDWDWNFQSDPTSNNSFYNDEYPFYKGHDLLPPTSKDTYKFFFGFGDNKDFFSKPDDSSISQSYVGLPTFRFVDTNTMLSGNFAYHSGSTSDSAGLDVVIGVNIRGWKYGIYDATPRNVSCFYRRNRYGQFRDMLEQRIFTTFFDVNAGEINPGPVEIKFMRMVTEDSPLFPIGSYVPISPAQADSYNKDELSRCSKPFIELTE